MTELGRRKLSKIVEELNEEYVLNGFSDSYNQNLNRLIEDNNYDADALIYIARMLECEKAEDKQQVVLKIQSLIIAFNDTKYIQRFAKIKFSDKTTLTMAMCRIAPSDMLAEFAINVKGARLDIIVRELADRKELVELQYLKHHFLVHRKQINNAIKYLKTEYCDGELITKRNRL